MPNKNIDIVMQQTLHEVLYIDIICCPTEMLIIFFLFWGGGGGGVDFMLFFYGKIVLKFRNKTHYQH